MFHDYANGEYGEWHDATAYIGNQEGSHLLFEGTPNCNGSCNSSMALDDLTLEDCTSTPGDFGCDFEEKNTCRWTASDEATDQWQVVMGLDHTTGTYEGEFLSMDGHLGSEGVAILNSPILPPQDEFCFSFYYKMYGDQVGQLRILAMSNISYELNPVELWLRKGSQGESWNLGRIPFESQYPFILSIEGRGGQINSPLAIDDLLIEPGSCEPAAYCGFEEGFCNWQQLENDDLDWVRSIGASEPPCECTPSNDHTMGTDNGYFLYMDSGNASHGEAGKEAGIEYAEIFNETVCFNMWYWSIKDNGFLEVRQVFGEEILILWTDPKLDTRYWSLASATLKVPHNTDSFKVQVHAQIGTLDQAQLAIDDLSFLTGECPDTSGHCNFEGNLCGWTNMQDTDQFDWILFSSGEDSSYAGPAQDITTGSTEGYSLIAPAQQHNTDDAAILYSPIIKRELSCMAMW